MRNFAIVSFLFLIVIIGGILFWQWSVFSEQQLEIQQAENISQEIVIETRTDTLKIEQSFNGLKLDKNYEIIIPDKVTEWDCQTTSGIECEGGKGHDTIIASERGLTFTYFLPVDRSDSSLLLTDWSIKLLDIEMKSTKIEIAEAIERNSFWIAGANFVGSKSLELIDYFSFESENESVPLYWESQKLTSKKLAENISIYSQNEELELDLSADFINKINSYPLSIVLTNNYEQTFEKGLIIINDDVSVEQIERQVASQFFMQISQEEMDSPVYDLFASLILKTQPAFDKSNRMLKSLESTFSEIELQSLTANIINENINFTAEALDDQLAKMKGLKTDFFKLNSVNDDSFALYFYEPKEVVVNDQETEIKVIVENNKRLYPFVKTMESLGYEVHNLSNQILLEKDKSTMRFYLDKNIFIYDEEDYGLLENPLTKLNNDVYIEQKWLKNIFDVRVFEQDNTLILSEI